MSVVPLALTACFAGLVAGCDTSAEPVGDVDPSSLGDGSVDGVGEDVGNLEAAPGTTSDEICVAAAEVERSVDDLDAESLEVWTSFQVQAQQTFDDFVAVAGDEFPEAVDSFEARLEDFSRAIEEADGDPLSGPLVLEETASELGVAGDLLVEALDCSAAGLG